MPCYDNRGRVESGEELKNMGRLLCWVSQMIFTSPTLTKSFEICFKSKTDELLSWYKSHRKKDQKSAVIHYKLESRDLLEKKYIQQSELAYKKMRLAESLTIDFLVYKLVGEVEDYVNDEIRE